MTEQLTEVRVVTLDDLKQAIEAMPDQMPQLADYLGDEPSLYDNHFGAYQHARSEAWRTAFEWRDKDEWPRLSEYVNGMRLIREKLR